MDRHGSMTYLPTSINQFIHWFSFLNIMEYTAKNKETGLTILTSLSKMFSMFQLHFWYNKESADKNR